MTGVPFIVVQRLIKVMAPWLYCRWFCTEDGKALAGKAAAYARSSRGAQIKHFYIELCRRHGRRERRAAKSANKTNAKAYHCFNVGKGSEAPMAACTEACP